MSSRTPGAAAGDSTAASRSSAATSTACSRTRARPAAPGDHVVIRLQESPSSGFRWQLDQHDAGVLRPAGDEFVPAPDSRTGGGGTRELRFEVVSREHGEVALSLRRAWESGVAAAQQFRTAVN